MYFQINIALYGKHFFATSNFSLTDRQTADKVFDVIADKFKECEGYKVSMTKVEKTYIGVR